MLIYLNGMSGGMPSGSMTGAPIGGWEDFVSSIHHLLYNILLNTMVAALDPIIVAALWFWL